MADIDRLLAPRKRSKKNEKRFQDLNLTPGVKVFEKNIFVTKQKGFGRFNVLAYQKRKYKNHSEEEPWFIITNLDDASEVIKYDKMRGGIEAMFRDYKSGGYNLEGSKANIHRLTNLILLIAIAYTSSALKGKSIKNKGYQSRCIDYFVLFNFWDYKLIEIIVTNFFIIILT